ncbi:MAG: phosphonate C-P lyase system protein PhnG [Pseudomonadota bacterium]
MSSHDSLSLARREWMSLLSKANSNDLEALWTAAGLGPDFSWLRSPQSGSVMVRGRAGATGAPFNLGEMTVTRCAVRLENGTVGHGYVAGRSKRQAEIAALCDAVLQTAGADAETVEAKVLKPLAAAAEAARRNTAEKAAATKVDFFTLVRGDT